MKKMLTILTALIIIGTNSACNSGAYTNDDSNGKTNTNDLITKSIIETIENDRESSNVVGLNNTIECEDRFACNPLSHIQVMSALKLSVTINDIDTNHKLFQTFCQSTEYDLYIGDVLLDMAEYGGYSFDADKGEFKENAEIWTYASFVDKNGCEFSIVNDDRPFLANQTTHGASIFNTMIDQYNTDGVVSDDLPFDKNDRPFNRHQYIEFRSDIWIENGHWVKDGRYDKDGNHLESLRIKNVDGEIKFVSSEQYSDEPGRILDISMSVEKQYTNESILYEVKAGELFSK